MSGYGVKQGFQVGLRGDQLTNLHRLSGRERKAVKLGHALSQRKVQAGIGATAVAGSSGVAYQAGKKNGQKVNKSAKSAFGVDHGY